MGVAIRGRSGDDRTDLTRVSRKDALEMNGLLLIAGVIAIVLLLVGGFNQALNFLLWVGIILLILAVLGWVFGRARGTRAP